MAKEKENLNMKLFYLGRSHANAAQAFGLRLDNTDKIENFDKFIEETFTFGDVIVIQRKCQFLETVPFIKEMGFKARYSTDTVPVEENTFLKLFPEFVEEGYGGLKEHLDKITIVSTSDGDLIFADLGIENDGELVERAFEAICVHSGVTAALETKIWQVLSST